MPGEIIDRPNPGPLRSQLPDSVQELAVKLSKTALDEKDHAAIKKFRRAATYIAAAMIFLKDNAYYERDLKFDDIKPRLLGHWGTCPGLVLVYANMTYLIKKHDLNSIFVTGPGHGAPAILACLWLEGSMEPYYPEYSRDKKGLTNLVTTFSTPIGLPSHVNAETPGAIHEGGELGYALATAFGAVMDYPDLIATVVIGDGEAESGPTATAWHGAKFIDPAESGAVLPIVHINGFKISERTLYGCMDDNELTLLFRGYGYQPRFVSNLDDIDTDLNNALEWAIFEIKKIQKAARSGNPITKPQWPVILMRTPKGWTGPKIVDGNIIEGSFHAHQVPLPKAKSDQGQLDDLKRWLGQYRFAELVTPDGAPIDDVLSILPEKRERRMGQNPIVHQGWTPITIPDWKKFAAKRFDEESTMQKVGKLIDAVFVENPKAVRLFSPDELESNKLSHALDHTGRNLQWDQFSRAQGGRVIEVLSEHNCQGFLEGYTLTGRVGIFPSYESFLGIITTMMIQFSKFTKMAKETKWRNELASINYIETSTWARQEHNGFSHQNPSFIGTVLNLKADAARVYLPPDANTFLSTVAHCLASKGKINLMVGSKQPTPVFLGAEEAEAHCRAGGSIWKWASTDEGLNPDVVLVGIGTELTFEVLAAAALLRKRIPEMRVRVVNVTDLMILGSESSHPHALSNQAFDALFTEDKPVHINYHGYAHEVSGLLFGRPNLARVSIASYMEEGSTTTPFDMMLLNHVSRYHVAKAAVTGAARCNEKVNLSLPEHLALLDKDIKEASDYIRATLQDPPHTYDLPRFE
ncbi:Xylulose 5-phosphate/Fructose 6-phosphate phosphoketolase [Ascosphaera apis ARSEF 7405]|uniref:Xylulose 5-phosphate/Fructose 6-phosphate phosphoketolase n=1 Tax=Ascosphaera apis ARSEF 7405 TaxID=392613 RepID=A0A168CDI2_9EURO|nr:Xylulose 5-phosphate/Fructose 6-phosphate phosphoketolase [Ascosphaera apis ARSEF 7405]